MAMIQLERHYGKEMVLYDAMHFLYYKDRVTPKKNSGIVVWNEMKVQVQIKLFK